MARDKSSVVRRGSSVVGRETDQRPTTTIDHRRVIIDALAPEVDGGRFPIKRTVGERVEVVATVFADGHDVLRVVLRDRRITSTAENAETAEQIFSANSASSAVSVNGGWRETSMSLAAPGTDRFVADFAVDAIGWHEYQVVGSVDVFRTWRRDLEIKVAAGQDVSLELLEGSMIVRDAARRNAAGTESGTGGQEPEWLLTQADALSDSTPIGDRLAVALADPLDAAMDARADRSATTASETRRVWVDRARARFGAWYEMFPRSAGSAADRSGTFAEAARQLSSIAALGFEVVYLPPIHPIGTSFRKGRDNSLVAGPGDPGSPWAIGSQAGGHTAIDPALGTIDDFHRFQDEAVRLGLEIALDLAWQCSPDHPWVREHPEWFRHRPDGTIKYAENPPKRYQDIYPFDFESDDWLALWRALLDVTLFWIGHGIRIFRVDNPHTKTFGFWQWFIDEIHRRHPDVIFLSEAFTRPAPMLYLAKAGFTQSYTYFTWRTTKAELTEYFTQLTATEVREYLRPNLFANTPDILHAFLQYGGRPAFEARLLLAATLGASYGIYSGFELCEGEAVPGTEEYAHSEKYEYRRRDWNRPGHIKPLIARVNAIRRAHPALQHDWSLRFHVTDNPQIIAYSKTGAGRRLLIVINLDPRHMQHGHLRAGVDSPDPYTVHDLLDDVHYGWRGDWNYVRLDPGVRQGHILLLPDRTENSER